MSCLPKRLLASAVPAGARADYESLLHDNYESPLYQPEAGSQDIELERLTGLLKVSVSDFLASARNLESPDELSVFIARRLMRQFAPSLLWITLHDIDIAHAGTFSLYVDAIRRTDRLCAEIWKMIQSEPEYAGRTSLFVLPDFGRDSDETPGGNGFQHHRTGRCALAHDLDAGAGSRHSRERARSIARSIRWIWCRRSARISDFRRGSRKADPLPSFSDLRSCSQRNSRLNTSSRIRRWPGKSPSRGLEVLRQLPLSFVPLLLGEVIAYDSKFPAERQEVDAQFTFMSALSPCSARRK